MYIQITNSKMLLPDEKMRSRSIPVPESFQVRMDAVWESVIQPYTRLFTYKTGERMKILNFPTNQVYQIFNGYAEDDALHLGDEEYENLITHIKKQLGNIFYYTLTRNVNSVVKVPELFLDNYAKNNYFLFYQKFSETKTVDDEFLIDRLMGNVAGNLIPIMHEPEPMSDNLRKAIVGIERVLTQKIIPITQVPKVLKPSTKTSPYRWYKVHAYHNGKRVIAKRGNLVPHSFIQVWKNILREYAKSDGKGWIIMLTVVNYEKK